MNPILQTLCTMTATASVAALGVMVLRLPLKKAPRWITCCLWLVVFLRMVCPVSFQLPVSLMPAAITQGTYLQENPAQTPTGQTPVPQAPAQTTPVETQPFLPAPTTPQEAAPTFSWPDLLTGLWLAGAGGMLLWGLVSYLRLRGRLREAVLLRENLYESDRIDGPFVCGFFSPRIYLPVGLSGEDRQYVLLHEQAHLRRRDHLAKPLAWLALCLHWWNPVLWLAYWLLCRDIETACDQAVIRSFDPDHTVQYATTLLRLGRQTSLPQAIPLAFGEENPKGRIRHVLDYKRPGLLVVVLALAVCGVVGVLLLANPGQRGDQLEGVSITQATVQLHHISLPLPEELRQDLVDLLKDYEAEYTSLESYTPADGTLCLSDPNGGTQFYLDAAEGARVQLVRVNHDGYSAIRKRADLDEDFTQDSRWQAVTRALSDYLYTQWPQELYALKTPYIGDTAACQAILEALHISQAVGPYTISLQTETEPYSITLHFTDPVSQDDALYGENYLEFCGFLFNYLVDNVGEFCWELPIQGATDPPDLRTLSGAKAVFGSFEDFQPYWKRFLEAWANNTDPAYTLLDGNTYRIDQILYWSDALGLSESYLPTSTFTIRPDRFVATLQSALSSAMPASQDYAAPAYNSQPASFWAAFPGLNGLPSSPDDYCYQVCDGQGNGTGYYCCLIGQSIYLAHTATPGDPGTTDYVVRLSPVEGQAN